ncbi:MAG: DUF882 domain-containing protein, partial [Syntrophaceae bacterium]|nr:DUF882 domain-containing protein [Syntrophaceae bacterium]
LHISRRFFLKGTLFTTALALLQPGQVLANLSREKLPSGRLKLYNIHTGEKINTTYRNQDGQYSSQSIKELNWLLRCHYTDQQYPIDIKTIEFLDLVSTRLGCGHEIHVISGYRSPRYNNYLLSSGHKVAKHSLHLEGRALDIRIPGTALSDVRSTAISLRIGGVGYYPGNDFVHIDSGAFRTW